MLKNYTTLNLPTALVEELKIWRLAFNASYGKNISYAQMIRGMLDCLVDTEPDVVEELYLIMKRHPELMNKMSSYRGEDENVIIKN